MGMSYRVMNTPDFQVQKQQSYSHDYSRTGCKYVATSFKQVACPGGSPLLKVAIKNQHYITEVKG